jgi:hypothetical protein
MMTGRKRADWRRRKTVKLRILLGLTAIGVLLLGVAVAVAGSRPIPTEVVFDHASCFRSRCIYSGYLDSPKLAKCRPHRKIKLYDSPPNRESYRLVDTDRSSKHGAWAVRAVILSSPVKIKATKKRFGPDHRPCGSDSVVLQ